MSTHKAGQNRVCHTSIHPGMSQCTSNILFYFWITSFGHFLSFKDPLRSSHASRRPSWTHISLFTKALVERIWWVYWRRLREAEGRRRGYGEAGQGGRSDLRGGEDWGGGHKYTIIWKIGWICDRKMRFIFLSELEIIHWSV